MHVDKGPPFVKCLFFYLVIQKNLEWGGGQTRTVNGGSLCLHDLQYNHFRGQCRGKRTITYMP